MGHFRWLFEGLLASPRGFIHHFNTPPFGKQRRNRLGLTVGNREKTEVCGIFTLFKINDLQTLPFIIIIIFLT